MGARCLKEFAGHPLATPAPKRPSGAFAHAGIRQLSVMAHPVGNYLRSDAAATRRTATVDLSAAQGDRLRVAPRVLRVSWRIGRLPPPRQSREDLPPGRHGAKDEAFIAAGLQDTSVFESLWCWGGSATSAVTPASSPAPATPRREPPRTSWAGACDQSRCSPTAESPDGCARLGRRQRRGAARAR